MLTDERIDKIAAECANNIERTGCTEQSGSDGQFEWLYDTEWVRPIIARAITAAISEATPPTTPAAAARDALVAAAVAWDLNGTDENWAALKFATRDYREALAAQEPTP